MAPEPEGDGLYALPLDEFTKARDALAARLKSAGDVAEAAGVKALKKPTTPAWAVNQLARSSRDTVEQLIAAADRLRHAQQKLLHGGPAQEVWEATLAEREALGSLTEDAERILTEAGYGASRATLDKVSDTLAAAAADPRGRALLRRGILTQEMQRAGFGDLFGDEGGDAPAPHLRLVPPRESTKPTAASKASPPRASSGGATPKALLEAERDAARTDREAGRAEDDADRNERAAERADMNVEATHKRLAIAEKEASAARAEATAATKKARAARREADRAAARLEKLRKTRKT
jgi:hypothetical protein